MAQVSRRFIKKERAKRINDLLLGTIAGCPSEKDAADLLDDLLTPTEKIMLSKRLAIAYLLIKGYQYQDVKDIVKVSTSTIQTISTTLKVKGNGLRRELEKAIKRKASKDFLGELLDAGIEIFGTQQGRLSSSTKSLLWKRKMARKDVLR